MQQVEVRKPLQVRLAQPQLVRRRHGTDEKAVAVGVDIDLRKRVKAFVDPHATDVYSFSAKRVANHARRNIVAGDAEVGGLRPGLAAKNRKVKRVAAREHQVAVQVAVNHVVTHSTNSHSYQYSTLYM